MALFSRKKNRAADSVCHHEELDPRWESMADAGIAERVDHYVCRRCERRVEKPHPAAGD